MKIRNNEMTEAKIKVKNIDSHFSELRKRIIFSLIVYYCKINLMGTTS